MNVVSIPLHLIFLQLKFEVSFALIKDPVCTTNGKFDIRAVNCANVYPDAACAALYGPPLAIDSDADRNSACFSSVGSIIDHELKSLSSEICPRQCGYCCQSPAYNCANNPQPRIMCDQVTQRMCRNPIWSDLLAEDCPNVCGFCERGCVDKVPDCAVDKSICRRIGLEDWVKINCQRTCGHCTEITGTVGEKKCDLLKPDNDPRCRTWASNGFCENPVYEIAFKRKRCATTCKIC